MTQLALLLLLAAPSRAVPDFGTKDTGVRLTSAAVQALTGAYAGPARVYYIRGSSQVYSATTPDGLALTEEAGVRLSSLTVPSLDVAVSSITGLSIQPLTGGGFRMLYSVIGTTGAFRIYSASSADGLAWANDTGTRINVDDGLTFAGFPSLVTLGSGDWRVYFIRNSAFGDQLANHQVFSALSTNQGLNWSTGPAVVAARAGEVSGVLRTDTKVRLFYTAPLTGQTTNTTVLSALSTDANGASFNAETGIRLSTASSDGTLSHPFVVRSTDSFRWRIYYDYLPSFAPPGVSTADVYSAVTDSPDPQTISPSTVLKSSVGPLFTLTGEVFSTGPAAKLTMGGQADIPGTGITRVDDQTITVTFDTLAKALGFWNLVVTNSNGLATTLANSLFIDFLGGTAVVTDNMIRPRQGTKTQVDVTIFNSGRTTVKLYTLSGELVSTLLDADLPSGSVSLFWDGKTSAGNTVSSGLYLLQTTGPKLNVVNKIVVIK